ncbi:hypothetical protein I4U23_009059 [Adineta vaga]|nr:hypothetical protein I4U23_009059 [Adineta vaga]
MIDCIRDMKSYANTIEKDLPNFSNTKHANRQIETNIKQLKTDDFLHLAKQRLHNNSYILLSDLIETKNKSSEHQQSPKSTIKNHEKSLLEKQVTYMKDVIATQPSALEGIYLEALLDPDQWQSNHQLLRTSPMDTLTPKERKRLNKILYKT